MFPSSGLLADVNCPYSDRGLCDRPQCSYRHGLIERDRAGVPHGSAALRSAGFPDYCTSSVFGAALRDDSRDDSLQELERINKEIETVKHEVEREQRRLSRYQTIQTESRNTVPCLAESESADSVNQAPYGLSSCTDLTKTYNQLRKYVVDNSKPRTDLEYDPLSNFSADLRSPNSSCKEQKTKPVQVLKGERDAVPFAQQKPVAQVQLPSVEPLDDFSEDHTLIIDIPPSPDKKRCRTQPPVVDCFSADSQGTVELLKELKNEPVPPLGLVNAEAGRITSAASAEMNTFHKRCGDENDQCLSNRYENEECEKIPVEGTVTDLTRSKCGAETTPEPASLPGFADQQDRSLDNQGAEMEGSTFRFIDFPPSVDWFSKCPAENSGSPCGEGANQAQLAELPAHYSVHDHLSPKKSVPPLVADDQKMLRKMPGLMLDGAAVNPTSSVIYLGKTEPAKDGNHCEAQQASSSVNSHLTNQLDSSSKLSVKAGQEEIIIISSSGDDDDDGDDDEEELNYSDVELSESDPMEECYRIFMEANNKGNEKQSDASVGAVDVEKPEVSVTPQALSAKKRMAHGAKHTEQPLGMSRPQPKVLVPLREPSASASGPLHVAITSKLKQEQQRASLLSASVKGGQAFVSSTCRKKPETQTSACPPAPTPANAPPAPLQNAYMKYLSSGTAVIEVGNNLHLILPEGTFPLPANVIPVTSVLTPVAPQRSGHAGVKHICHKAAVTPVQRYHTTAPVLIRAPTRKPSLASASAHPSPAASATAQLAVHAAAVAAAAAKPLPTKRKLKQQREFAKVPHDVRQRYINMFTEEFLKTTANVNDAFEKAVAEERIVYNRSPNKLKYLSVAVNALKRLRNQTAVSAKDENENNREGSKDDVALYESLSDYILTEEKLIENNYPVQHPEKPGCAVLFSDNRKCIADPLKRICCRCGATYSVGQTGKHVRKEECNYHYGKGIEKRVPGGVETRYSCCQGFMGAPGCQVFQLHVHDSLSLDGFVATIPRKPADISCPGVYALDCETCYTVHGLELSRVTVVNSSLQVVYDTFVRPDSEVIDYNTRFSGISEEDVKGNNTSVREVQETLLSFVSADTILIGHGLETDFCALKLLHGTVADTSVVFPHRLGPPHKLTLKHLTAELLRKIIQGSVCGHDTAEDATACMELILWKIKDGKLRK